MKRYLQYILACLMLAGVCDTTSAVNECDTPPQKEHDNLPLVVIPRAYVIGDFNNWQLPIPDDTDWDKIQTENLNGALCLSRYLAPNYSGSYSEYRWEGSFPSGDTRFAVYIPEKYCKKLNIVLPGYYSQNIPVYLYSHNSCDSGKPMPVSNVILTEVSDQLNVENTYVLKDWTGGKISFSARTYVCYDDDLSYPREEIGVGVISAEGPYIDEPAAMHFIYQTDDTDEQKCMMLSKASEGIIGWGRPYIMGLIYNSSEETGGVRSLTGYFEDPDTQQVYGSIQDMPISFRFADTDSDMSYYVECNLMPDGYPITITTPQDCNFKVSNLEFNLTVQKLELLVKKDTNNSVTNIYDNKLRFEKGVVHCVDTGVISVYNTSGVKVAERYGTELDLRPLGRGIYFVRTTAGSLKVVI